MYSDHTTAEITQEVTAQLAKVSITLEQLVSVHMGAVRDEIAQRLGETTPWLCDQQLGTLKVKLFLSVPQMWPAESNQLSKPQTRYVHNN